MLARGTSSPQTLQKPVQSRFLFASSVGLWVGLWLWGSETSAIVQTLGIGIPWRARLPSIKTSSAIAGDSSPSHTTSRAPACPPARLPACLPDRTAQGRSLTFQTPLAPCRGVDPQGRTSALTATDLSRPQGHSQTIGSKVSRIEDK